MSPLPLKHTLLLLFFLAFTVASLPARAADTELESSVAHVEAVLGNEDPILFCPKCPEPIYLSRESLRTLRNHQLLVLAPRNVSPFSIRVRVVPTTRLQSFAETFIRAADSAVTQAWWSTLYNSSLKMYEYHLSLSLGPNFESRAEGQYLDSKLLNWNQSGEYRLLVLNIPRDPEDPQFSVILQDELRLNVKTTYSADAFLPRIEPELRFRPANVGLAIERGRRTRIRVGLGGGYTFSSSPGPAESAFQGFLRLRIRFR